MRAPREISRKGRARETPRLSRMRVLGQARAGIRGRAGATLDPWTGARGAWGEPHGTDVHRRPLRRFSLCGAAQGKPKLCRERRACLAPITRVSKIPRPAALLLRCTPRSCTAFSASSKSSGFLPLNRTWGVGRALRPSAGNWRQSRKPNPNADERPANCMYFHPLTASGNEAGWPNGCIEQVVKHPAGGET